MNFLILALFLFALRCFYRPLLGLPPDDELEPPHSPHDLDADYGPSA